MSALIQLQDLSSFFELFVAYNFAYSSLDSVKAGINKATVTELKKKVDDYEALYNSESDKVKDIKLVGNEDDDFTEVINTKISDLDKAVLRLKDLYRVANTFYSGDFLKPAFYLAGTMYLFFIVVSAFQSFLGDLTVMYITSACTLAAVIFYVWYYFKFVTPYRNLDFKKIQWIFPTRKVLKIFIWIIASITFISFIWSLYVHHNYPLLARHVEARAFTSLYFTKKDTYHLLNIVGIFTISVIPFIAFYKREDWIKDKIQDKINESTESFEKIHKEIKFVSKSRTNIFGLKTTPVRAPKATKPTKAIPKTSPPRKKK